jgi:hypothetical protein
MGRKLRKTAWALGAMGIAAAITACDGGGGGSSTLDSRTGSAGPSTPVESPAASGDQSGGGSTNNGGQGGTGGTTSGGGSTSTGSGSTATSPGSGGVTPGTGSTAGGGNGSNGADPDAGANVNIDQRQINYGEALRTASLKLLGDLPTLVQINQIAGAANVAAQKTAYESLIDTFLADPRFSTRMIQYWRDTLKTGAQGTPAKGMPSFDTAATFAAMVVVNDQPYTDLFTATTGTCATYANGTFTGANCGNGAPTAGLLTDPGLMAQYFANMAFRRARFVQETFVCSKFPAEYAAATKPMGAGTYTSPWDFNSITGGATAKINFQDTSAVICANCHTTMNHIAPLFAHFDATGQYDPANFQVQVPVPGTPTATLGDWLPAGQGFAWRNGTAVTDIPSLGKAMAADPDVARCAVNRVWNFAMSRGDIVNDQATIPPVVTDPLLADFTANGMKMKRLIRNVFTSDDFVKF